MDSIFNKPITEVIRERHSVRSYDNVEIPEELIQKLEKYINEMNNTKGIFGKGIRIKLIKSSYGDTEVKLGTYGIIKGAKYFLAVAYKKEDYSLEDLGFLFEKVILYCTSLGLGTVWIGGTFNKSNFAKAMDLKGDEALSIVSAVGIEGSKKSILAKMFGNNTNKRKDFSQIFFNGNFETPLNYEEAKAYGEVLEMVRLAPSAINKQPWRILKEGKDFHIYSNSKKEMNRIDMGICLCHFYLSAKEKGLNGEFKVLDNKDHKEYNYLISWIEK